MSATTDADNTTGADTTAAATAAVATNHKNAAVEAKLPIRMISTVVRGFGRGSSDLGIPTANLERRESDGTEGSFHSNTTFDDLPTGIYWGFARIGDGGGGSSGEESDAPPSTTYTTACSIGYNPTYGNDTKTVEPHLIAPPADPKRHASSCGESVLGDFYDKPIRLSLVGYLRPELPFEGLEKLIVAIKQDIEAAEKLGQETADDAIALQEKAWVSSTEKSVN